MPLTHEKRMAPSHTATHPPVNVAEKERAISLAAGAIAVVLGVSRINMPGLILAGIGAGLLRRGATGYCPAYQKLGINTAESQR